MWFKNLSFFRLDDKFLIDAAVLSERLAARPFQPPGGLDWFGEGWVPPAGHLGSPLHLTRGYCVVSLKREDKELSAGVIREHLNSKIAEVEAAENRKVGRK